MAYHCLRFLAIAVSLRFKRIKNPAHLFLLILCQFNVFRSEVLFKTMRLCCAGDRQHSLGKHPRKSNLSERTTLALCNSLDLLNDLLVIVEVLALEFGDYSEGISHN